MNISQKRRVLTGITTTGSPHLGNYVGAIRPAIAASRVGGAESFYFLADYHALVKCQEPERIHRSTLEIAATWLACGLDPDKVFFYRQSDIPEIPELTWFLTCVCGKGLLNRAHAYKAAVDINLGNQEDPDAGVNAGLFMYPVLMAADILIFNAHDVPVGKDQIQHIEMARDMAARFNHIYGSDYFVMPEARVDSNTALLPGLDGRKMSKSYNNTIPLWLPENDLRKALMGIVTNSLAPGEPKDPNDSSIFTLYQAFANSNEIAAMRAAFAEGISWGDAKLKLFERIEQELSPLRDRYYELISNPEKIENQLQKGAQKARECSRELLTKLRHAVGLRKLANAAVNSNRNVAIDPSETVREMEPPSFKQYRENDGKFYFKILASDGSLLMQSGGFDQPKEAGQVIAKLKQGLPDNAAIQDDLLALGDAQKVGELADGISIDRLREELNSLAKYLE